MGVEHDLNSIALKTIAHRGGLLQHQMADMLKA
jgi:hypothetical protein